MAPESERAKWEKWLAWVIVSPFLVIFAPLWIPCYGLTWALFVLGCFDDTQDEELQRIANAQYEAAKKAAETSYMKHETR